MVISNSSCLSDWNTGNPSSSCEMIILRNNSCGGIIRDCMGIFTTALRNKKVHQILKKNTSPFFMYFENLEMENSLKCVLFIKVSGQITSNTEVLEVR